MNDNAKIVDVGDKNKRLERSLLVCFSICFGLLFAYRRMLHGGDCDYMWHTVLADYILEHKALPTLDVFSWRSVEMGYVETAHSWLGSLLLGSVVSFFTKQGYSPLLGGRVFSVFWYLVCTLMIRHTFFKKKVTWAYPIVCALVAQVYGSVRIQNISDILFILMLYVLYEARSRKWLVALPIITLLCANIHGGTVVLYLGVMLVYTVWQFVPRFSVGYFKHEPLEDTKLKWWYTGACLASAITVLINPYKWNLYTYFLHVGADNYSSKHVLEWMPISSSGADFRIIIVILAIILLQRKSINLLRYGIVAGFLVLSCKYRRFSEYAMISAIPLLISYCENYTETIQEAHFSERFEKVLEKLKYAVRLIPVIGSIVLCLLELSVASVALMNPSGETFSRGMLTEGAVAYLQEKDFQRPFNYYNQGAPLIYAGFRSFVDSRADPFVGGELEDMATLVYMEKPVEELDALMDKYAFDAVIVPDYALYGFRGYISEKEDWVLGYEDEYIAIYEHINVK